MAGSSGEDEKIASARATGQANGDPVISPTTPEHVDSAATPPAGSAASEWTVSDRRGPLKAVTAPEDDVERFVPGSETDAEGTHDTTVSDHGLAETPASTFAPEPASSSGAAARAIDPEQVPAHAEGSPTEPVGAATRPGGTSATAALAPPRRSVAPLAISLLLGAAIGAGSAALVYTFLGHAEPANGGADGGQLASLSTRVDALEKRADPTSSLAKLKSQLDENSAKLAGLAAPRAASGAATSAQPVAPAASPADKPVASAAPAPSPAASDTGALNAKIAALQASVDALQKQAGSRDLAGKLEALQASLAGVQTLASTARSNVDTLKSQQQSLDGKLGDLRSAVGNAQKQASDAKSGIDGLQTEQKNLAGKLGAPALAVVADSLVAQVASGRPYATQVDALATLGADPVKVALLRQNASSGVASAQALLAKFHPFVDPIVATGTKAPANANFGQRLLHGMVGLVSVRRTDVTTGNDLSSKVTLIQSDLANDDIVGAFGVWDALPADAKRVSEAWGASAKASVEAVTAARGLQTQSIGSLAAKKS